MSCPPFAFPFLSPQPYRLLWPGKERNKLTNPFLFSSVKAILDANRNSLMLLELKFSIITLGIGAGTFIAALYGMNLKNFIEDSDFGFPLVSLSCSLLTVLAVVYGLRKLRRVQRLSMWGEGSLDRGRTARGSWREVDPQRALSGEGRVEGLRRFKEEQRRVKMQEVAPEGGVGVGAGAALGRR